MNLVDPLGLDPATISFLTYAAVTFLMTVTLGLIAKQCIENNPPIFKSDPFPGSGVTDEQKLDVDAGGSGADTEAAEKCPNSDGGNDDDGDDSNKAKQQKKLTKGEIKKLKKEGVDIHELKGGKNASKFDLFKDKNGDIFVKPKSGAGPGDPTGLNINNF